MANKKGPGWWREPVKVREMFRGRTGIIPVDRQVTRTCMAVYDDIGPNFETLVYRSRERAMQDCLLSSRHLGTKRKQTEITEPATHRFYTYFHKQAMGAVHHIAHTACANRSAATRDLNPAERQKPQQTCANSGSAGLLSAVSLWTSALELCPC